MKLYKLLSIGISMLLCLSCAQEKKEPFSLSTLEIYGAVPQGARTHWISPDTPNTKNGRKRGTGKTRMVSGQKRKQDQTGQAIGRRK